MARSTRFKRAITRPRLLWVSMEFGNQLRRFQIKRRRQRHVAALLVDRAHQVIGLGPLGLESDRPRSCRQSFAEAMLAAQRNAVMAQRLHIVGLDRQGALDRRQVRQYRRPAHRAPGPSRSSSGNPGARIRRRADRRMQRQGCRPPCARRGRAGATDRRAWAICPAGPAGCARFPPDNPPPYRSGRGCASHRDGRAPSAARSADRRWPAGDDRNARGCRRDWRRIGQRRA